MRIIQVSKVLQLAAYGMNRPHKLFYFPRNLHKSIDLFSSCHVAFLIVFKLVAAVEFRTHEIVE